MDNKKYIDIPGTTAFSAAMSFLVSKKEWGGASAFSRLTGISQGYISELMTAKKHGHEKTRRNNQNS